MGLQKDANITGAQFSQLAMIFYVSYLLCEFPHAYGMQTLPTAKYLASMVTLWGVIVVCTSAAKNWAGLVTTRVLLGVFESAVAPSLMLITVSWYKVSRIRLPSASDDKKNSRVLPRCPRGS
jgi:MFS family permease